MGILHQIGAAYGGQKAVLAKETAYRVSLTD
jgi:hypothetical protein